MNIKIDWLDLQKDLVKSLSEFYKTHEMNSGNEFYKLCMSDINKKEFLKLNPWAEKFKDEWKIESFDPMHIFSTIYALGIKLEKKIKKIKFFYKILGVTKYENISIENIIETDGIPHLQLTRVVSARNTEEQEKLWTFFAQVNKNQSSGSILDQINIYTNYYGIGFSSITIFLYWINSKIFLPMDKATESLIRKFYFYNQKEEIEVYKKLVNLGRMVNDSEVLFLNISRYSYNRSFIPDSNIEKLELMRFFTNLKNQIFLKEQINKYENLEIISECEKFDIFAISLKNKKNVEKHLKALNKEIYCLNRIYKIVDNKILYNKDSDISIYDNENYKINLNVIIGKNGEGKSTIVELILKAFNNIIKKINHDDDIKEVDDLYLEIFFSYKKSKSSNVEIFNIVVDNSDIKLYKSEDKIDFDEKNKLYIYEIDRTKEKDISILRNFIPLIYKDYSLFSLNSSKETFSFLENMDYLEKNQIIIQPKRIKGNIDVNNFEKDIKHKLLMVLLNNFEDENKLNDFRVISTENEKIRKKFKYIEFSSLPDSLDDKLKEIFTEKEKLNIKDLRIKLEKIRYEKGVQLKELLPVGLNDVNFFVEIKKLEKDDIPYGTLSSGEKQLIYSFCNIYYYLQELNNNDDDFKNVLIVLDEMELYLHPEMQREFLSRLLNLLKNYSKLEKINIINIIIITHSPLIVSDIIKDRTLILGANKKDMPTFASNIHELFSDSFFLTNTVGAFAYSKILDIGAFYKDLSEEFEDKKYKKFEKNRFLYEYILENIGEPYLKKIVENTISEIDEIKKRNTND